ncbi:hypothetical protein SUGI_1050300 [Cryptomeria japonica]|nr:hypothetical protein SUGI_1050300 [Cryptomeria japonica]
MSSGEPNWGNTLANLPFEPYPNSMELFIHISTKEISGNIMQTIEGLIGGQGSSFAPPSPRLTPNFPRRFLDRSIFLLPQGTNRTSMNGRGCLRESD